jgi:hypothetical protein
VLLALAALGFGIALYLSLDLSLALPNAALGALAHFAQMVGVALGSSARWRRRPWLPIAFGTLVGSIACISVTLAVLQPLIQGAWGAFCLMSTLVSVILVGPAVNESLASLQGITAAVRRGADLGRTVRHGVPALAQTEPPLSSVARSRRAAMARLATFGIGVGLMAAPGALPLRAEARDLCVIAGPLTAASGIVASFAATAWVRWAPLAIGLVLLLSPWTFGLGAATAVPLVLSGGALIALAAVPGADRRDIGGGWRVLLQAPAARRRRTRNGGARRRQGSAP